MIQPEVGKLDKKTKELVSVGEKRRLKKAWYVREMARWALTQDIPWFDRLLILINEVRLNQDKYVKFGLHLEDVPMLVVQTARQERRKQAKRNKRWEERRAEHGIR